MVEIDESTMARGRQKEPGEKHNVIHRHHLQSSSFITIVYYSSDAISSDITYPFAPLTGLEESLCDLLIVCEYRRLCHRLFTECLTE